jgi:hypothetical protein
MRLYKDRLAAMGRIPAFAGMVLRELLPQHSTNAADGQLLVLVSLALANIAQFI